MKPEIFYNSLKNNGVNFFAGVPDSLLKNICAYITDNTDNKSNVITANEGSAISLAAGHYLASGDPAMVYMQNSGIGNAVNPLLSLADTDVYSIPMLLMIGWRGEPGVKDEPQHVKQGKVTVDLLETMGIDYVVVSNGDDAEQIIKESVELTLSRKSPVAIVVKKGTFEDYKLQNPETTDFEMNREEALKCVVSRLSEDDVVVSTTGKTSRELFEYREELNQGHSNDFLTVGSMGHSSQIALGIALKDESRKVYCFDGDGAMLMHLGGMATIGSLKPKNFIHILFNNGAHDSVGGQPTVGFETDFCKIALACNYNNAYSVSTEAGVLDALAEVQNCEGPVLLEIKVNKGGRSDLGRPTTTPVQNKEELMKLLKSINDK